MIEEGGVAEPGIHQMDLGPQGEAGVGVAQPLLHLLDVPPVVEEQRRAGVPEGVEGHGRPDLDDLPTPVRFAHDHSGESACPSG